MEKRQGDVVIGHDLWDAEDKLCEGGNDGVIGLCRLAEKRQRRHW
jgi:hypothetical protein